MAIQRIDYSIDKALPIQHFSSSGASSVDLAHGTGESHAYAIHIIPGGLIGPHPAGFDQLFLVMSGSGWVAGNDGIRHKVEPCHGAFVPKGETHSKGSETGMVAIMIQVTDFTLSAFTITPIARFVNT
jgi:quercetin dioxygenase-like cupin family protein